MGSDQGLDFMTMAHLSQVYIVDIDQNTHVVTRSYLEAGSRFHQLFNRYPTSDEFIQMFGPALTGITLNLLTKPSSRYTFDHDQLTWLQQELSFHEIYAYLKQKKEFYGKDSWVGTDKNLKNTIEAYEAGRIKVCQGDVVGDILPVIGEKVRQENQYVSLIYLSNAPLTRNSNGQGDQAFKKIKNLPINRSTKVIYTARWGSSVDIPDGYMSAFRWSFHVFHPTKHKDWPLLGRNETQVSNGILCCASRKRIPRRQIYAEDIAQKNSLVEAPSIARSGFKFAFRDCFFIFQRYLCPICLHLSKHFHTCLYLLLVRVSRKILRCTRT